MDAWHRLASFLACELERDDVPVELAARYRQLLETEAMPAALAGNGTPIEDLGLPPRLRAALRRAGIETAGAASALTFDELAIIPYIGAGYVAELRAALVALAIRAREP